MIDRIGFFKSGMCYGCGTEEPSPEPRSELLTIYFVTCVLSPGIHKIRFSKITRFKVRTIHRLSFQSWFIGSSHRLIVLLLTVLHILPF